MKNFVYAVGTGLIVAFLIWAIRKHLLQQDQAGEEKVDNGGGGGGGSLQNSPTVIVDKPKYQPLSIQALKNSQTIKAVDPKKDIRVIKNTAFDSIAPTASIQQTAKKNTMTIPVGMGGLRSR